MYRICKRLYSSNVIEKNIPINGKDNWVIFVCPTVKKELGDDVCEELFNYFMSK